MIYGVSAVPRTEHTERKSWGEWFVGLAEYVSTRSKDPSTKCGCVIVRPDKTVCSIVRVSSMSAIGT